MRIGKKWGETLDIEDNFDSSFGRKRLCIKTKQPVSTLESFKIIFKGKVLLVRAKELFTWNPTFLAHKEMVYASKDESVHSLKKIPSHSPFSEEVSGDDSESDVEEVSKTIFGDNSSSPNNNSDEMGMQHFEDPFKIYDILKKETGGETREVSSYLSYPPGFTSEVSEIQKENDQGTEKFSSLVNSKVMNNSQEVYQEINRESLDPNVVKEGGFVLGVLEDMIQVGQAMGYKMDGCVKDFERIISTQRADDQASCKRVLWEYVSTLIGRWNGETIILEGYAFTWSHPSGSKMSKLDRFLVSEDFGLIPIRFYHSWFILEGFDAMVEQTWRSFSHSDVNRMIRFKKKLQDLKAIIQCWVKDKRMHRHLELQRKLHDINQIEAKDSFQKSKIKWAIEGEENSKFFHGKINKKRSQLAIRGVFDNGLWCTDPGKVKKAFFNHFEDRFKKPIAHSFMLNFPFNKRLSHMQAANFERNVSRDEIRLAVWNCGENKSLGLKINIHKSQVLGVGFPRSIVMQAVSSIGCGVMHNQFRYLGVMVGECMSRHQAWDDTVLKLRSRLSNWKVKPLSIDGRLTLLKSVLGGSPLYNMSIFKDPKGILKSMEAIRSVSSFHAPNRALLLKWVWRFISQDGSLWFRVIQALYGPIIVSHPVNLSSNWCSIVRELHLLTDKGFDLLSHCKKCIGDENETRFWDGNNTQFWSDIWKGDRPLKEVFPRVFVLELDKEILVDEKVTTSVDHSLCRPIRGGVEQQQRTDLALLMDSVSLSLSQDRWVCDLSGDGEFRVKEIRNYIDDMFLPVHPEPTRWVKGVTLESTHCPLCRSCEEDIHHVLFRCDVARTVLRRMCRWWDLDWEAWSSFSDWNSWFSAIRLSSKVNCLLEGVFCVAWWSIWLLRNRTIFDDNPPSRSMNFDDINGWWPEAFHKHAFFQNGWWPEVQRRFDGAAVLIVALQPEVTALKRGGDADEQGYKYREAWHGGIAKSCAFARHSESWRF
uniref:RNA-directed DNA polymerase, eukaryota n=1 Tax=Tanacetum cinerariifolium TaxID=118510 RepID=A0A6L2MRY0_TANCI|nr:RNA-directed DNA polymerase, eukaryota [Tanacetum cinerariifolium]